MRTVSNPKGLFRKLDASDLDDDSGTFHIAETGESDIDQDSIAVRERQVTFEDYSDPLDDFEAALDAISENATTVEDVDEHDADVDAKFATEEDGELVVYMADTDVMGYEVVRSAADPRLSSYEVISTDALVKVEGDR